MDTSTGKIKIERPLVKLVSLINAEEAMKHLELVGRVSYKSEDRITDNSYEKFLEAIMMRKHESVLEHVCATVLFHTDRGISHELVRHRLCAFTQSSTRYCDFTKDKFGGRLALIPPATFTADEPVQEVELPEYSPDQKNCGKASINSLDVLIMSGIWASWAYRTLTGIFKRQPQESRCVLPTCIATDIYVTANLREWRHILKVRALGKYGNPHPDMRHVMLIALDLLHAQFPIIFRDIFEECKAKNLV